MKKFFISYFLIFLVFGTGISEAQGFVDLREGRTQTVYGFDSVGYSFLVND